MARTALKARPTTPAIEGFAHALAPEVSTPVSLPAGLDEGELVVATNKGDNPITIEWASKKFVLRPGKPARIPFEAACLWFGDPRSGENVRSVKGDSGLVTWIPDRPLEIRRLRLKYGNHFGDESGLTDAPDVGLETMEGATIPSVIAYPDGVPTMTTPGMTDMEALKVQILRQQNTINQLLEANGIDLTTTTVVEDDDEGTDIPVDTED